MSKEFKPIEVRKTKAEEGGNQPVRTLLVGGLKHGESMNFPEDQKEWELIESNILAGIGYSTNDDRYVGNVYRYDQRLSQAIGKQVFSHAVLWEPEGGGRYPQLLRLETKRAEKESELRKAQDEKVKSLENVVEGLEKALDVAATDSDELRERLGQIRVLLEHIGTDVHRAVFTTGRNYDSPFNS